MVILKSIILYDRNGAVVGFVELRREQDRDAFRNLAVKVKHNLGEGEFVFSINLDNVTRAYRLEKLETAFAIETDASLDEEIFVSVLSRNDDAVKILASGILNIGTNHPPQAPIIFTPNLQPKIQDVTVDSLLKSEVDNLLRSACSFEDDGVNACGRCPYREQFFNFQIS